MTVRANPSTIPTIAHAVSLDINKDQPLHAQEDTNPWQEKDLGHRTLDSLKKTLVLALGVAGLLVACLYIQPPPAPIFSAVEEGDRTRLGPLLRTNPQEVHQTLFGRTPLHVAVVNNQPVLSRMLVEAGAPINAQDEYGNTPLHVAVFCLRTKMVAQLLALGASVNLANNFGSTPLHVGAFVGAPLDIMRQLLDSGADANLKDGRGRTPLDIARNYHPVMYERLVDQLLP